MEILEEQQPLWQCDCSKERLEEVVISLGKHEIQDMIEKDDGAGDRLPLLQQKILVFGGRIEKTA